MTGDVEAARRLLRQKSELRQAELAAADRHFERLREGRPESLETTSLHLDILSDLKRIHSHICSVAYPVLEAAGELKPIRFEANSIEDANAAAGLLPAPPRSA
jgi:phosphate:Na+ symporter